MIDEREWVGVDELDFSPPPPPPSSSTFVCFLLYFIVVGAFFFFLLHLSNMDRPFEILYLPTIFFFNFLSSSTRTVGGTYFSNCNLNQLNNWLMTFLIKSLIENLGGELIPITNFDQILIGISIFVKACLRLN